MTVPRTATTNTQKNRGTQKSRSTFWIFIILASCFLVFLMPAIFALVLVGMVPTWIAGFVERHGVSRVQVTAALNFAGVLPFMGQLWAADGSLRELMQLAGSVYTWAVVYGSASMAIAYLWVGPHVAAMYLDFKAARYVHFYEKQKTALVADWGDALAPLARQDDASGKSEQKSERA
jgi:hypothetical protein